MGILEFYDKINIKYPCAWNVRMYLLYGEIICKTENMLPLILPFVGKTTIDGHTIQGIFIGKDHSALISEFPA